MSLRCRLGRHARPVYDLGAHDDGALLRAVCPRCATVLDSRAVASKAWAETWCACRNAGMTDGDACEMARKAASASGTRQFKGGFTGLYDAPPDWPKPLLDWIFDWPDSADGPGFDP